MANCENQHKEWYSILDAKPTDDLQVLKQKYQRLVLMFHPDKQRPDMTEEEAKKHLQRFLDVDQAWKTLSNEEMRREYDLQLRARELKQSWPVDAHIALEDMIWDDDTQSYTYACRCGGEYILGKEETEEEEATVCCDTCSLSIEVRTCT
ncbi:dnaJ homolog subfamily C member 24 [Chanos chanos]|uniref:DnaJ homolog subfamily C member 24 n=1 Tax=Chanos chanos TaxID=29144 RepID=A0A6J2WHA7_CHACN|nr:dnaJ homolog subfamily C member 24 [Chanos chanos]